MFRSLFSRNRTPLTGAPAVRRVKNYAAQSGYAYQYFYKGHRDFRTAADSGIEFVFRVSGDRKVWQDTSVLLSGAATDGWQQRHTRELSPAEKYAIAKIALFQAFDERSEPPLMKTPVVVRPVDIDAIVETLGL